MQSTSALVGVALINSTLHQARQTDALYPVTRIRTFML